MYSKTSAIGPGTTACSRTCAIYSSSPDSAAVGPENPGRSCRRRLRRPNRSGFPTRRGARLAQHLARFFAQAQVLAVAIGRVERLVQQPEPPVRMRQPALGLAPFVEQVPQTLHEQRL